MGKGQACAHGVAKFPNCRCPYMAQSNLCRKKKDARQAASAYFFLLYFPWFFCFPTADR